MNLKPETIVYYAEHKWWGIPPTYFRAVCDFLCSRGLKLSKEIGNKNEVDRFRRKHIPNKIIASIGKHKRTWALWDAECISGGKCDCKEILEEVEAGEKN